MNEDIFLKFCLSYLNSTVHLYELSSNKFKKNGLVTNGLNKRRIVLHGRYKFYCHVNVVIYCTLFALVFVEFAYKLAHI